MYTLEPKQAAIDTYLKVKSHRKTIRILGYPGSRNTLKLWIREYENNCKLIEPQFKKGLPNIPRNKSKMQLSIGLIIV